MRPGRKIVVGGLTALALAVAPGSAAAESCAPVINPYEGTRYEGVDLTRIRGEGVPCEVARKVAKRAHRKALGKAPKPNGTLDFDWRKWDVHGVLTGDYDWYVARRGPDRVHWRF